MTQPVTLPTVMGHRGAAALAPENTLAGLDAAAAAGCAWVEVDVRLSADGVPVLHHDADLRQTAGLPRRVAALSAARLSGLDVGRHFAAGHAGATVPSLDAALRHMAALGLRANLELKPLYGREVELVARVAAVLDAVSDAPGAPPLPLLSSFSRRTLAAARDRLPACPRGLIVGPLPRTWARDLAALGCASIHVSRRHLSPARTEAIKGRGYGLAVYTVNDPEEARLFRRWGADCAITDDPRGHDRVDPAPAGLHCA